MQRILKEEDREKLARYRLSRKVDANPNLIWCTNKDCEGGFIELQGSLGSQKAKCLKCEQSVCVRC